MTPYITAGVGGALGRKPHDSASTKQPIVTAFSAVTAFAALRLTRQPAYIMSSG